MSNQDYIRGQNNGIIIGLCMGGINIQITKTAGIIDVVDVATGVDGNIITIDTVRYSNLAVGIDSNIVTTTDAIKYLEVEKYEL